MKQTTFMLLIIMTLLLAACQDEASETTEVPQATAVPEPTAAAQDTRAEEVSTDPTEEPEAPEPTAEPTGGQLKNPLQSQPEPSEADTEAEESDSEEAAEEAAEAGDASTVIADEQLELMAAIAPPPQLSDRELGVHPGPCLPGISLGVNEIEGEDYTCGTFTVPQNWEEPDGRNLDLAFVVVKATSEQPASEALLFLSGGPGQRATGKPIHPYQHLRADRDIILLDQRGTGFSQRLGYEECLVLALQNDAPAAQIEALQVAAFNPLESPTPLGVLTI